MKRNSENIEQKNIADLIPYENNPRKNDKAVDKVANSIREFGFKNPIIIDENNVIICGHTRLKAAKKLGIEMVPCIVARDLTDEQIKAYRLADNKVGELAEWDRELLSAEFELLGDFNLEDSGFSFESELDSEKYISIGEKIQYEPKSQCPKLDELMDNGKERELLTEIENSKIDEETKEFLRKAAARHREFNFSKIAEFYSHQKKEIQELMESSGLVIIDFKDAIKNGFVELDNSLRKLAEGISDE